MGVVVGAWEPKELKENFTCVLKRNTYGCTAHTHVCVDFKILTSLNLKSQAAADYVLCVCVCDLLHRSSSGPNTSRETKKRANSIKVETFTEPSHGAQI